MKNSLKIALSVLAFTSLIYAGCKKSDLAPIHKTDDQIISQKETARKLALSVYQSLSYQLAADRIKTSGNNGLTTMSNSACGTYKLTPTNRVVTSGDTVREYKGNSKFTYMCDGLIWAGGDYINAYKLDDTLKTTVVAKGFWNTFNDIINFHVRALDGSTFSTDGSAEAKAQFVLFDKETSRETEQNNFSTKYVYNRVIGIRVMVKDEVKGKFISGTVDFQSGENYINRVDASKNSSVNNSGLMVFKPNDMMDVYFRIPGSYGYYKYVINLVTGDVSEPKVVESLQI